MKLRLVIFSLLILNICEAQDDKGQIQPMSCIDDSSQHYSLLLPNDYSGTKKYPLILFLDPAARGSFPLEKYKSLSAKYGFIFAGSMNSRNFDGNSSIQSFVAMYNDITSRFHIDSAIVWLSGFSGGSRAANNIAATYPEVKGVIACGAGFIGNQQMLLQRKYPFVSLVGNGDMNFWELSDINDYFEKAKSPNLMVVFTGGHMWPPADYFETSMLWAMDQSGMTAPLTTAPNESILKSVYLSSDSGYIYEALRQAEQLEKIPMYKVQADSFVQKIGSDKSVAKDKKNYYQILNDERQYMDSFGLAFNNLITSPNPVFNESMWRDNLQQLSSMRKSKDHYRHLSGLRCADFSWRAGAEYYQQLMEINQFNKAYAAASVMNLFNPDIPIAEFFLARAAAAQDDKKLAAKHLKNAVKKGVQNTPQITSDGYLLKQFTPQDLQDFFNKQ